MIVLVLFILFHVIADFYLQGQKMAKRKISSYKYVLFHSFIYFITIFFLFIFFKVSSSLFLPLALIGISHFIIDSGKYFLILKKKIENKDLFVLDQMLHLSIFVLLYLLIKTTDKIEIVERFDLSQISIYVNYLLSILLIFKPANILIKSILPSNKYNTSEKCVEIEPVRLGKMIGNLERLLILLLLFVNQYVVIGYIFTAKSIARWKKLSEDKDFAEYYLVGTLLSVIIALIVYFIFIK